MDGDTLSPIGQSEYVARCIVTRRELVAGDSGALLNVDFAEGGRPRRLSVIWRGRAPDADDVHRRGCEIARLGNARDADWLAKKSGRQAKPQRFYCGFAQASRSQVEECRGEDWKLVVEHAPENDDDAHAHICFVFTGETGQEAIGLIEASDQLSAKLGEFAEHCCEHDRGAAGHPLQVYGAGYLQRVA